VRDADRLGLDAPLGHPAGDDPLCDLVDLAAVEVGRPRVEPERRIPREQQVFVRGGQGRDAPGHLVRAPEGEAPSIEDRRLLGRRRVDTDDVDAVRTVADATPSPPAPWT